MHSASYFCFSILRYYGVALFKFLYLLFFGRRVGLCGPLAKTPQEVSRSVDKSGVHFCYSNTLIQALSVQVRSQGPLSPSPALFLLSGAPQPLHLSAARAEHASALWVSALFPFCLSISPFISYLPNISLNT